MAPPLASLTLPTIEPKESPTLMAYVRMASMSGADVTVDVVRVGSEPDFELFSFANKDAALPQDRLHAVAQKFAGLHLHLFKLFDRDDQRPGLLAGLDIDRKGFAYF